jgi:hypothetical protein
MLGNPHYLRERSEVAIGPFPIAPPSGRKPLDVGDDYEATLHRLLMFFGGT